MSVLPVIVLLVVAGLFVVARQLRRIDSRIDRLASQIGNRDSDSIHNAIHPVFSIGQLCQARKRFEIEYKNRLQLETNLYDSNEWRTHSGESAAVSPQLLKHLRTVCEMLVQCECAWKEYVWMVEANLSVAAGRESRTAVLEGFRKLLDQTRGTPVLMTVAPNATKVRRVEEILSDWTARLGGATVESLTLDMPDIANETFDVAIEEKQLSLALARH